MTSTLESRFEIYSLVNGALEREMAKSLLPSLIVETALLYLSLIGYLGLKILLVKKFESRLF